MKRRSTRNPKRRMCDWPIDAEQRLRLHACAAQVKYGGNPDHKRRAGDFGLSPPARPRLDASLCDGIRVFKKREALELLRDGFRRGLVSVQRRGSWPQNVWSVAVVDGVEIPVEAALENQVTGTYHGYPLLDDDPFGEIVIQEWHNR